MPPVHPTHAADQRLRTGAIASGGATTTKVPNLLHDWKRATVEACAEDLAEKDVRPELISLLAAAEKKKGAPLGDDEREKIDDTFHEENEDRIAALAKGHVATLSKSPKAFEAAVTAAVSDHRADVQRKRDPFTPVIQQDPAARAKETVLWESASVLVLVDLFSPRPKALVIPKAPFMFPTEADDATLQELALVAAYVSDAFHEVTGVPPAGTWINPPQHLMVKQLHVHVLPKLPLFSPSHEPLMRVQDPAVKDAAHALFAKVTAAIEKRLGPTSP